MKQFISAVWLSAMLLLSGCGSTKKQTTFYTMKVSHLWQGNIPLEYNNSDIGFEIETGETDILIPEKITINNPLHIEVYGNWQSEDLINCYQGWFEEAKIETNTTNHIVISLARKAWESDICPTNVPSFSKRRSYDINGTWQSGTLEVIVQNPDGNLTGYVTVE